MSYTFPSCVPVDFPASDANSAHSPPSGILRPLRSFRHWGNSPQPTVPQNHASPLVAPRRPRVAGFHPRWGNGPVPARSGAGLGPTGASLVEVTGEAGKQENHFHFSASLRLETKGTVVSNPHNPPLWGGQAERLPDVVGQHKRRAGLACRLGRLGAVPTGDPRPCTHFCRKERSL